MRESSRRTRWVGAAVLPALVLTGCGGEDEIGAKPELPTEAPALWNPCDELDEAFIEKAFGSRTTEHAGTRTAPECRFAPAEGSGEAVVTATYLLFPGSLEDAWETMGQPPDADVREPRIDDADGARIVVSVADDQLFVTGFVQNSDLIQKADVVDPAPFDQAKVVRGMRDLLTKLSVRAEEAGVGEASPKGS